MATATHNEHTPAHRDGNGYEEGPNVSPVTPAEDARTVLIHKVAWGAVLAGVAVSLIAHILLNMLGLGIGANAIDPTDGARAPAPGELSVGAAIWWVVAGIIAAFIGGIAAGRLSGKPDYSTAAWHGLTAWAVTTLIMLWLLTTTLSSIVGGSLQMIGSFAGQVAQGATRVAGGALGAIDPLALMETRVRADTGDRGAQISEAVAEIRALLVTSPQQAETQRERAVTALARAQDIPRDQARAQVERYEEQYREFTSEARETATEAAGAASRAISWTAILGAIALALGGLAGWFGGRVGAVDPTITPLERIRAAVPRRT